MKIKKKTIITAAVLVAVGVFAATRVVAVTTAGPQPAQVRTGNIQFGDLAYTVSTTGTVYSQNATEIYSSLTYPVQLVNVEVGDVVKAGDVLAELDISEVQSSIAQKSASISKSQATAYEDITAAQRELANAQAALENNQNSELHSAQVAVRTAEVDVRTAEAAVRDAEVLLEKAGYDVLQARSTYNESVDNDEDVDSVIKEYRWAKNQEEIEYENLKEKLDDKNKALDDAHKALTEAQQKLEIASVNANQKIDTYQDTIDKARISSNMSSEWLSIEQLRQDIGKASIVSPISGTITAVMAKEGAAGNGLLFVIQDANNLRVVTNVKEYDIQRVQPGHVVEIKTDATGDEVYDGVLNKIAPTSTTATTTEQKESTQAEFETEILVTPGSDLRIGMNARLSIITQKKENTKYVPFEAVGEDPATGDTFVYIIVPGEKGSYTAKQVPVDTGLETDFYCEVISDELTPEDIIIMDAMGLSDGSPVSPMPGFPVPMAADTAPPEAAPATEETQVSAGEDASQATESSDAPAA